MSKYTQEQKNAVFDLLDDGLSQRSVSAITGVPKSTIADWSVERKEIQEILSDDGPVITFLDVETSGTIGMTFRRFKAFITPDTVIQEPYLLTAAWKTNKGEEGARGLHHYPMWDIDHREDIELVCELWEVLDKTDILIAHNASFDSGWITQRMSHHGMVPPSPYKVVCTLKALKKYFKLPSNSLDAATRYFDLEQKRHHEGPSLWLRCMEGDVEAMDKMLEYNKGDIPTLEQLYYKILPFIKNHPNLGQYYSDDKIRCNNCGSTDMNLEEGKFAYTNLSKFETYRCGDCGAVKRTRKNTNSKDKMSNTLMNIV